LWKHVRSRLPSLAKVLLPLQDRASGEMAEWLKAHAWKACVRETVPWVRIPLSPPVSSLSSIQPGDIGNRSYLKTWVTTSCRTGCRGLQGFLLQVEVSGIILHEAGEPNAVVGFLDAGLLTGQHGRVLILLRCRQSRPRTVTSRSWNG
jgi:hypothetical protein